MTTLKGPTKRYNGTHTVEVFAFVSHQPFAQWSEQPPDNRSEDYQRLKERISDGILNAIERRIPGFRERVVFQNLSTPLTNSRFINATHGNLYGIAKSRFQVGPWAFDNKTEMEGLWLCGASCTTGHGIVGVTYSGLRTASRILGCSVDSLLGQNGPELRTTSSK